jgi:transcriptional regulator with XRE-family HTH domain
MRNLLNMTQPDMAAICGYTLRQVQRWETGESRMPGAVWKYFLMVTRPDNIFEDHKNLVRDQLYPVAHAIPQSRWEFEKASKGLPPEKSELD